MSHHHYPPMRTCAVLILIGAALAWSHPAAAMQTDSGEIARFERYYLTFVIDHHYGALRMTELAAGTAVHRAAALLSDEGTAPTPGFSSTGAKAALAEIKTIARKDNRVQREEILQAQRMLAKWYRVSRTPRLSADARVRRWQYRARRGC